MTHDEISSLEDSAAGWMNRHDKDRFATVDAYQAAALLRRATREIRRLRQQIYDGHPPEDFAPADRERVDQPKERS
jgi:hypothetical protein